MITEPSIPISRIKSALSVSLELGKLSQEAYDEVLKSLMFDWETEKWKKQQTKEGFCELLATLLEHYDASIDINSGLQAEIELRFNGYGYADLYDCELNADFVRCFPKMMQRRKMFNNTFNSMGDEIQSRCHIDKLKPLFTAMRKVRGAERVTDARYKEMLKDLKEYLNTL